MRKSITNFLVCPNCSNNKLKVNIKIIGKLKQIKQGTILCPSCFISYPINNYIPRFVQEEGYTKSFGMQWSIHARTQIDKFNGTTIAKDTFFDITRWDENEMRNKKVLEVGCGAGRFTSIILDSGAKCFSMDYSKSVDVCLGNNFHRRLNLFQGDIYKIPFKRGIFDKIFCIGVLQHTPDVKMAFLNMIPYLKPGGEIVVNVYPKQIFRTRDLIRPFTRRMDKETLYKIISGTVPFLLPIKMLVGRVPLAGKWLDKFIPIANYKGKLPVPERYLVDWSILGTFDCFSPAYDNPQTGKTLKEWFKEAGLEDIELCKRWVCRGRMPT